MMTRAKYINAKNMAVTTFSRTLNLFAFTSCCVIIWEDQNICLSAYLNSMLGKKQQKS